ncbi:MAG TPA: hypothetical protein VLK65_23465 [Vicinamibacteria bacterium]|nr:hypothetical protein [Vicinamibacteria bacterium]
MVETNRTWGTRYPSELCDRSLVAFTHITRTGGNSLIHVLRYNYFLRCCDVRPLSRDSGGVFGPEDMIKIWRINPLVECIVGHAVRPNDDLDAAFPGIRYITLLRDPAERYVSQYLQHLAKRGYLPFEHFLKKDRANRQTRFIAGAEDLSAAKQILAERYLAVGVSDQFDEFLVLLSKKLAPRFVAPSYRIVNVSSNEQAKQRILARHRDRILETQRLDTELYNFVRFELFAREKARFPRFDDDVRLLEERRAKSSPPLMLPCVDYLVRHVYYRPATGIVRVLNGLPARGQS